MVHRTVLKVDISCDRCKQEVFGIVSKLEGVNKIEADSEKGTIAVVGDADPYNIIMRLRKAGKSSYFISVGPPPKPNEKPKEKPDEKPKDKPAEKPKDPVRICHCPCPCPYPSGCWAPRPITVMAMDYQDPTPPCSIM